MKLGALANYVVTIRIDHAAPNLPLGGKPWPKIARKTKEAMTGTRYRFRADHKIRNGFLSPDTWNDHDMVLDRTALRLPQNMVPGRYNVFVKFILEANKPNVHVRDLFYDDDSYQGVRVGGITIE